MPTSAALAAGASDYDSAEGVPPNLDRDTKAAALAAHYAHSDGILHGGAGTGAADYAAIDDPASPDYEAFKDRPAASSALYGISPPFLFVCNGGIRRLCVNACRKAGAA